MKSVATKPFVLIVEDEPLLALGLEDLLAREGYDTAVAATAAEADAALRRRKPSVALVDLRLRDGLTGPDIALRLHRLGVPVIVQSGERRIAQDIPAVAWLTKPVSDDAILASVRRAIDPAGS